MYFSRFYSNINSISRLYTTTTTTHKGALSIEPKLELLRDLFSTDRLQLIPYTSGLHLQLHELVEDKVSLKFDYNPGLVGNPFRKTLHGGCIGAVLDQCAGMVAVIAFALRDSHELTTDRFMHMFSYVGTVDLRIDYLAPGRGEYFIASAEAVAVRNKIITTQMTLLNNQNQKIALGTGSFFVDPKPKSQENK